TKKAPTFIRNRNQECSSAGHGSTLRTAAFIVTASKCAPIMRRTISNENGEIVAARRAITFSSRRCSLGKCEWARTSQISARAPLRNRRALRRLALRNPARRHRPLLPQHREDRRRRLRLRLGQTPRRVLLQPLLLRRHHRQRGQ